MTNNYDRLDTLELRLHDGARLFFREYEGYVILLAFMTRTDCGCEYLFHALERLYQEYGARGFRPVACLVDVLPEEKFAQFEFVSYPVSSCSRRRAADVLRISMSGFYIPELLFLDRRGNRHALFNTNDAFCRDAVNNTRILLENLLRTDDANERLVRVGGT